MTLRGDTKTQILDVSQDLIQRRGINGMSYHDISEAVGIRKASIHHHFPTKDDLLESLLNRYLEAFDRQLVTILNSDEGASAKLKLYMSLFEATIQEEGHEKACLCGMMGAEAASLNAKAARQVERFFERNADAVTQILERGRDGEFRFSGDARTTARLICSFLQGGLILTRSSGRPDEFEAMTDQMLRLLGTTETS